MVNIEQVIKETSKQTKIDIDTVEAVCKHVFKFTVDVMKDENDYHDILFNKLFKIKLKNRFKDNKTKDYSPND